MVDLAGREIYDVGPALEQEPEAFLFNGRMEAADYGLRRIARPCFACLVCFEYLCRRALARAQKAGQVVSKENGIADSGKILAFVIYSCDAMLCHECFLVNLRPVTTEYEDRICDTIPVRHHYL